MVGADDDISISRQCELLGVSRTSFYYRPVAVNDLEDRLMKKIDRQYLVTPFYGSRRMAELTRP